MAVHMPEVLQDRELQGITTRAPSQHLESAPWKERAQQNIVQA